MFYLALGLLALAAVFGLLILKNWLTSADTARTVVYAHGLFAAGGLALVAWQWVSHPSTALRNGLLLLVLAAIGGFYIFLRDLRGKFSPTWLAVVHGLLAVAGFVVLLFINL